MMASVMDLKSLCIILVVSFDLDISALTSKEVSFHDSSSTIVLNISGGKAYIKIFKNHLLIEGTYSQRCQLIS